MKKNEVTKLVKECVQEMMGVGMPENPAPKKQGKSAGVEKTIKNTDQVIDALTSGRIDAATAKKLIAKIAKADIDKASLTAGLGCQY